MLKREIKGKKLAILLSAIFLVSLFLMTANIKHGKGPIFLETVAAWIFTPFQNLFTQTVSAISEVFDHYIFLVGAAKENEALKDEMNRLARRNNDLTERILALERTSKLVDYGEVLEQKSLIANVIGRDATQWSKMVVIDKGTGHGVEDNLAVVREGGIVGHVIQASNTSSKVLLITDSRSAVDALFQKSRESGVVAGLGERICEMKYVSLNAQIEVGDRVLSSGLGGVFPKGLIIGSVSQVLKNQQELFQNVMITPGADLARLEEVLVLLKK